jgi:hypothetical protein
MTFDQIIIRTLQDTGIFFSVFFVGAYILSEIQRVSNRLLIGLIGYKGMILSSFPGVILHELNHFIFCIIFGHKVIKMRLFEPNLSSGSLGYVNHSYNPRSTYQQIGNFFIGMAPLIGGSLILFLMTNHFFLINQESPLITSNQYNLSLSMTLYDNITTNFDYFINTTKILFNQIGLMLMEQPIKGAFVSFLLISIASHASPSKSDLQGARSGAITVVLVAFVINTLTYYFLDCCAESKVSYWLEGLNVIIIYFEIVMVNLICFTIGLALVGFSGILTLWTLLKILRTINVRKPKRQDIE